VSLRDLCDVVYVMQVEQLESEICALIAAGAEFDPDKIRADYEAALVADFPKPRQVSDRERQMLRVMGA
jgi:hypothetical protein